MTVLDALVSRSNYADHLLPVAAALREQGVEITVWGPPAVVSAYRGRVRAGMPPRSRTPALVASHADGRALSGRPLVLMEHGSGQSYGGSTNHPAYAGGQDRVRDRVLLFVCPGEVAARAVRAAYPQTPVATVGCPRLDAWFANPPTPDPATVALAFHWDARAVCPEAGTAWPHYAAALPQIAADLRDQGLTVLGHGHPRAMHRMIPAYRAAGIEVVADVDEVFARASILAGDNTSLLWEWASTGRPIILLDAPWYRRDMEHGLRFWQHADSGLRVGEPEKVAYAVAASVGDHLQTFRDCRVRAVADVYAHTDGQAGVRAAASIRDILDAHDPEQWLSERRAAMANPKAPRVRRIRPVTELLGSAAPPDVPVVEQVPDATIRKVLAWAGEDRERVLAALRAEQASGKPRVVLVTSLERALR